MTSIDRNPSKDWPEGKGSHPRPTSDFLPADGKQATVAESMCLLIQATIPFIKLDSTLRIGPDGAERDVSGADVVGGIRLLLASDHDRSLMNELILKDVMPHVERAMVKLGYSSMMVAEEQEAEE